MRVLLFNENPVVTKLVTLSAQKTGDQLQVCSDLSALDAATCDLLIVDDALWSDENAEALTTAVTAKKRLLMATRGKEQPAGFDHTINKPFLPTDLVELFGAISKALPDEEEPEMEDLDMELPDLESDSLDLSFDEDAHTGLELDDLEADDEFTLDLDIPDGDADALEMLLESEDEADSEMLLDLEDTLESETPEASQHHEEGILDKEELAEVQSLLEDAENGDMEIDVEGLDAIEGLDDTFEDDLGSEAMDDLDTMLEDEMLELSDEETAEDDFSADLEGMQNDDLGDVLDNDTFSDLLEDEEELGALESEEDDDDMDALLDETAFDTAAEDDFELPEAMDDAALSDIEEDLLDDEAASSDALEMALDDFDDASTEDLDDILGDTSDEAADVLDDLEGEIEDAMAHLSDEELDTELDADALLELVDEGDDAPQSGDFDELDALDEMSLKVAIGEADECELDDAEASVDAFDMTELEEDIMEAPLPAAQPVAATGGKVEGVEALKALLKALESDDVARSLKGMNISVNISFGEPN